MPKKPLGKQPNPGSKITIDMLAGMMKSSFEHLEDRLDKMELKLDEGPSVQNLQETEKRITDRLDKIEFRLTGEDQRISILEDRMRQIAMKVGMEFSK